MSQTIRHYEANNPATHDPSFAHPHTVPQIVDAIGKPYNAQVKDKHLSAATEILDKHEHATEAVMSWRARRDSAPYSVLEEYATGAITPSDFPTQLAQSVMLADAVSDQRIDGLLIALETQLNRAAATELRQVPEAAWLKPFRPIAERLINEANALADQIGMDTPRRAVPGNRSLLHPWEPDATQLGQTSVRHAWESLSEKLTELYAVLMVPVVLRRHGLIPTITHRPLAHQSWWLHLDELNGDPSLLREFFLANRHTGGLGLWSTHELDDADHSATLRSDDERQRHAHDAQYTASQAFRSAEASTDSTPLGSTVTTPSV